MDRRDDHALISAAGHHRHDCRCHRTTIARRPATGTRGGPTEAPAATRPNVGARSQRPRRHSTPRTAYTPNRRHDSPSSATYPPTRPRQSRPMLSAISPAPRRQSGSAHRTAPGRSADLRSLSRPLPLRSCSSFRRSRTASCRGRSSPSAKLSVSGRGTCCEARLTGPSPSGARGVVRRSGAASSPWLKSGDRQDRSRVLHCRHGDASTHGPRTDAGVVDCRERAANDGRSSVLPTVEPGARRAWL